MPSFDGTQPEAVPPLHFCFLGANAGDAELVRAIAANHAAWFTAGARAGGGERHRLPGVAWTWTGEGGDVMFPALPDAKASDVLDTVLTFYRERGSKRVGVWSLSPTRPRSLGARLCARGFEWGWQPHWMALDLQRIADESPTPDGLAISCDDTAAWDAQDLPYYTPGPEGDSVIPKLVRATPRRTWRFVARWNGQVVGQTVLFVTTGARGLAGIYNVGVVPAARRQGIGRAITAAACRHARVLGCRWAGLNAATHIYAQIGFRSLGYGQTWWMHEAQLAAAPPSPEQVLWAEAVGRGDLAALRNLHGRGQPPDLDAPLPCGLSPIELAVRTGKPQAVKWLHAEGATLDVRDVWELGWKTRVAPLLMARPELVNLRRGGWQTTPLHHAVQQNDLEFLRLLLAFRPDLTLTDSEFKATPLGWARHFRRAEMVVLLEAQQEGA